MGELSESWELGATIDSCPCPFLLARQAPVSQTLSTYVVGAIGGVVGGVNLVCVPQQSAVMVTREYLSTNMRKKRWYISIKRADPPL